MWKRNDRYGALWYNTRIRRSVNRRGGVVMLEGEKKTTIVHKTVKSGITFGSALAMVISYTTWHSVGWAIVHGLLSWIYVIYFLLKYA